MRTGVPGLLPLPWPCRQGPLLDASDPDTSRALHSNYSPSSIRWASHQLNLHPTPHTQSGQGPQPLPLTLPQASNVARARGLALLHTWCEVLWSWAPPTRSCSWALPLLWSQAVRHFTPGPGLLSLWSWAHTSSGPGFHFLRFGPLLCATRQLSSRTL